jgi:hypothetical protein
MLVQHATLIINVVSMGGSLVGYPDWYKSEGAKSIPSPARMLRFRGRPETAAGYYVLVLPSALLCDDKHSIHSIHSIHFPDYSKSRQSEVISSARLLKVKLKYSRLKLSFQHFIQSTISFPLIRKEAPSARSRNV